MMALFMMLVALALIGRSSGNQDGCYYEEFEDSSNYVCNKKPADYPSQEVIDELIKQNGIRMNTNSAPIESDEYPDFNYNERKYLNTEQNCETIQTTETPFVIIRNISSEISRHIIIQSAEFEQEIVVVRCKKLQNHCFTDVFADAEQTSCEPLMAETKLYAYDEASKNGLKIVTVKRPFYCYCKIY